MNRPRLVLVKPPEDSDFTFGAFSLGVLAGYVRDVCLPLILDCTTDTVPAAVDRVQAERPDLVGVTVMSIHSIPHVVRFVEEWCGRAGTAAVPLLVGGQGAAFAAERFLEAGAAAVVVGEGETVLRRLVCTEGAAAGPGTVTRRQGRVRCEPPPPLIEPLDLLPRPARELMPPPAGGIHLLETSRGCPHHCAFCAATRFHGQRWRPFPARRVADDVADLVERHSAWTILLADDNFSADPARTLEICERIRRGPLPAVILASCRADDVLRRPEIIPALAAARILRLTVGVETLEAPVAAAVGKAVDRAVYRRLFTELRRHGIFGVASFIVGLPGQEEDDAAMVEDVAAAGPDVAVFVPFTPLPDTPLGAGHADFSPAARDVARAARLNRLFTQHAAVRRRLAEAEAAGGVRGMMARAAARHAASAVMG